MKTLRRIWSWSWLVTLPVCAFFVVWATNTTEFFERFAIRYDPTPMTVDLWETGRDEFRQLVRRMRLAVMPNGGRGDDHADDLRTISLYATQKRLAKLDSDLPYSGFDYVKAGLFDGRRVLDVKLRYRGDFARHWAFRKKSLRVKTSTDALFEGMRSFNLIVPKFAEHLNNYLAYRLAARLGLLVPRTELVHVSMNGEPRGVHVLVEQLDESTLRANGVMPGDLYSGDLVAKDSYRGIANWVFDNAGLWEKLAINNHYPPEHREPLEKLIALLNAFPSEENSRALEQMLDLDAWARFSAFESLARTYHYDLAHNWRLYYDLNRSVFVPVVWDPVGWAKYFRLKTMHPGDLDVMVTRLHTALFANADFLRARHRVLESFYAADEDDAFLAEVDQTIRRMNSAIAVDPNLWPPDEQLVGEEMASLRDQIALVFERVERTYLQDEGRVRYRPLPGGQGDVAVSVEGHRPVERLIVDYDRPLTAPRSATLHYTSNGEPRSIDVSGAVKTDGHRLEIELGLLSRRQYVRERVTSTVKGSRVLRSAGYYELAFEGLPQGAAPIVVLADRGGDTPQNAERVESLRSLDLGTLFAVVPERPRYEPLFWRGTVDVAGVQEIDRDLVLEPGTEVRLQPGASVIVRGRVLARGTAARPILFVPAADPTAAAGDALARPWGTFAIQGAKSRGSEFAYCRFSEGSGLKDDLREYSAMFSVHDTGAVRVEHCSFADSNVVDDMVHAVYSEVAFADCTFQRSLSDALDLDICRVQIQGCRFENSGNDAVDLMTSEVVVWDSVLEGSGDKGISVGEGSALLVVNDRFVGNAIGIQAKDTSQAVLVNTSFEENALAVDAYKKNWRYGDGGRLVIENSTFERNQRGFTADKYSSVTVRDSYVDRMPVADSKRRVVLEETVDDLERETARAAAAPATGADLPEHGSAEADLEHLGVGDRLRGLTTAAWREVDSKVRGARLE